MSKMKIRRGDKVIMTTGKDKGKTGVVLKVLPKEMRIVISGINVVKKHTKPSRTSEGGIIPKELPVHISNAAHVDPKTGAATKVGFKVLKDGTKTRIAKKSGELIKSEGK